MDKTQRLELARRLVEELEADDESRVIETLHELVRRSAYLDDSLFQEVGRLTRELHEAIKDFALDEDFAELVQVDMPDATERLNYVIETTEGATHQTINAIENMMDVSRRLKTQSVDLEDKWSRFLAKDLPFEEFKNLCAELSGFLQQTATDANQLHDTMNETLMAQGFQDITGQIIKKVISLLKDVESRLIDVVVLAGDVHTSKNDEAKHEKKMAEEDGPAVPGVTQSDVVKSQDDVDDLLSSLGF